MSNLIIALLAGTLNGLGDFATKVASNRISPALGAIFLCTGAAIPGVLYLLFINHSNMLVTKTGVLYSIAGGFIIGIGTILFFTLFSRNVNLSIYQPVIKTMVVLTAVVLSFIFFPSKISWQQILGIIFSLAGIYLLVR